MRFRYLFAAFLLSGCLLPASSHADFDLADNYRPARYTGDGSDTTFDATWPVETDAQVKVYVSTDAGITYTLKTLATHYTVTGEGQSAGFTVTFGTAPADDSIIVIERDTGVDRGTDLTTAEVTGINTHMDQQVMHDQETEDIARRRSVQIQNGDDYNAGDGSTWVDNIVPHVSDDTTGDPLCFLAKTNADNGYRITMCEGFGGGVCATCEPGTCDGGDNDGDSCASEEDCPGGDCDSEYENCDYLSTADGVTVCNNGTCPDSCSAGDGEDGCLDCSEIGTCDGGTNDGNPCTDDADCPGGGTCEFTDDVCFGGSGDGDACTDDADCPEGGVCRLNDDVCLGGASDGESCTTDADCPGGFCVDPGDGCSGCADPCIGHGCGGQFAGNCIGGAEEGEVCNVNADCDGGICTEDNCGTCGGLCVDNADCGDGCTCDVDNVCLGGPNDGDACTDDTDCLDVCTALVCVDSGGACATNTDCAGTCAPEFDDETCQGGTNDGDPCTDDADCPAGGRCDNADGVGVRGPAPPVEDSAIALWDGINADFIKASRVTIGPTGFMRDVAAISFSASVSTATGELVTWQYPVAANQAARVAAGAWYLWPFQSPDYLTTALSIPQEVQYSLIGTDPTYEFASARTVTAWSPDVYPVTAFVPGVPGDGLFVRIYMTEPIVCLNDWAGSYVKAATAATASTTINLQKNNSTVGTAIFAISGTTATLLTSGAETQFAVGDYLDIDFPATADVTAANISVSFKCYRSATNEVN